jgi:hypothetical protein
MSDVLAIAVEPGWTDRVTVAEGKHVLFYPDGAVRFEHRCDRSHRAAGVIVCAPALQIGNGHTVVTRDPLTIVASILCSDCGTHGFVTAGRWVG